MLGVIQAAQGNDYKDVQRWMMDSIQFVLYSLPPRDPWKHCILERWLPLFERCRALYAKIPKEFFEGQGSVFAVFARLMGLNWDEADVP
jgi:hypothetical protein